MIENITWAFKRFSALLAFSFRRCLVLYLVFAALSVLLIDHSPCADNRLNGLKYAEEELMSLEGQWSRANAPLLKRGLRYYKALAKVLPRTAAVYGNIGLCYFYLNDPTQAVEAYQKAISLEGDFYGYYWDLGMISFSQGDYAESVAYLKKGLKFSQKNLRNFSEILEALNNTGHEDSAYLPLKLILRAKEDDLKTYVFLAKGFLKQKEYGAMREWALRGLAYHRDYGELYYLAGLAEVFLGGCAEALAYLNKAIDMDPENINAYLLRARCMKEMGHDMFSLKDMQTVEALRAEGYRGDVVEEDDFNLHLNSARIVLTYQVKP